MAEEKEQLNAEEPPTEEPGNLRDEQPQSEEPLPEEVDEHLLDEQPFNPEKGEPSTEGPENLPDEQPLIEEPLSDEVDEHEFHAEQFNNYLRIAKSLMKTLKRPKDIDICNELMRKVERLSESKHLEVKRNNNRFFRYCLKVLNWTSVNQPLELYRCWYNQRQEDVTEALNESHQWLEDKKSYIALKSLKDGTKIIYVAMSNDPEAGWQDGGLNILAKRGACQLN